MRKAHKKKISQELLESKILYFAYGSNLMIERLEHRVGKVIKISNYELKDYRLVFDCGMDFGNFANIIESEGSVVYGVIYEMTYKQLKMLDRYELLYNRIKFELKSANELLNGRKLHVYISPMRHRFSGITLTDIYYKALLVGSHRHGLERLYNELLTMKINVV